MIYFLKWLSSFSTQNANIELSAYLWVIKLPARFQYKMSSIYQHIRETKGGKLIFYKHLFNVSLSSRIKHINELYELLGGIK